MTGDIRFDNVVFSYDGSRDVLDGVSFHVRPGEVAAFVGPSGAGKTTITAARAALLRSAEWERHRSTGTTFARVTLDSLRRDIGIVTQETYLFHDTIAQQSALRQARCDAMRRSKPRRARRTSPTSSPSLPDGYETVVGERGHKLSGGERQRLAIARVLLKDPRILILDEATSSLDYESEAAIQKALEIVMRGRTSLVIAHRLSTVLAADVIFVVDAGRIVESGRHATLLARGGLYARLYRTQFQDLRCGAACMTRR